MLTGNYRELYDRLLPTIDRHRMYHDPLHTLAFGTDASFYRLIPRMVIKAKSESEVSLILEESSKLKIPVTFRAAGTSHRVRTPSYTQEEKDKITLERTELAAVVGIIFGIAGSFTYEMGIKKNNGKPSAEASEEN